MLRSHTYIYICAVTTCILCKRMDHITPVVDCLNVGGVALHAVLTYMPYTVTAQSWSCAMVRVWVTAVAVTRTVTAAVMITDTAWVQCKGDSIQL